VSQQSASLGSTSDAAVGGLLGLGELLLLELDLGGEEEDLGVLGGLSWRGSASAVGGGLELAGGVGGAGLGELRR
jgi:hypothetical protein